ELLLKEIHPTTIISGYKKALEIATEYLYKIAESVDISDRNTLRDIARTALTSKAVHGARDHIADISVEAVLTVAENRDGRWYVDLDNVQIVKKHGGSILDTKLVKGVILDKEVVHPAMPRRVTNARIALLDAPLEIEKPEIDAEIRINDPTYMRKFLEEEENILGKYVDKIASVGANVVICQKGIDDVAQHFLAKKGIMAVRRVKRSDMEKLERATGGRIVSNIDDLTENDLGYAELVEERKVGEDKMVFIEGTKNPKSVSILVRGGLERLVDETERTLRDSMSSVADVLRDSRVVYGGGATEIELALYLREYSTKVGGKEALAIEAFAKALEGLAITLLENAGMDPVEYIMKLRAGHREGQRWLGVDVLRSTLSDMKTLRVIEPVVVKANALKAGTEAATLILRIDDMIAAARTKTTEEKKKEEKKEEEEKEKD
ncbi:MAG: thermosome subunit beta, partial [Sulfolobales archaeon]